jgi:alkylation response protein AidB-like acyl-CoA dehydrogenase
MDIFESANAVQRSVEEVAAEFAADRAQRQARTTLDPVDFDRLAAAGVLRTGLPAARGGLWADAPSSARAVCEIFRTIAHGDSSVALVASMHPSVLAFWLATPAVPAPHTEAWAEQCDRIFAAVEDGAWFGTITSEPGSGGDVMRSKAVARRDNAGWRLDGQKHFGSGTGISRYMLTAAVPEGEDVPDWFYVPMQGVPLDGTEGVTLIAPWDGHGMQATQSHALAFADCRAERFAWPGHMQDVIAAASPIFGLLFTAVVLGVVETAVDLARSQLAARRDNLRPFEQMEWAEAELEAWTLAQVYEGALRAVATGAPSAGASLRAKTIGARLAESCLLSLCRVLGGGTFSRRSPFGNWFEDVRALGFLRPPWALAYDGLFADSFAPTIGS